MVFCVVTAEPNGWRKEDPGDGRSQRVHKKD
jgi:hypothetical protein